MDTGNWQGVGVMGKSITVMFPKSTMTADEALFHAAWLVALADPIGDGFDRALDAVLST